MAISDNTRISEVPGGMPVLSRGHHFVPEDGSCLMEYVSVLAGERFCDHPRTAHPGLALLARYVNDSVGGQRRGELARLAPALIGTASGDIVVWDIIIEYCIAAALQVAPGDPALTRRAQAARAQAPRLRWRGRLERWLFPVRCEAVLRRACSSLHRVLVSRLALADREQARIALLDDAVRAVRTHLELAPITAPAPTTAAGTSVRTH